MGLSKFNKRSRRKSQRTKKQHRRRHSRKTRHTRVKKQIRMRGGYEKNEQFILNKNGEKINLTLINNKYPSWQNNLLVGDDDNEYYYDDNRIADLLARPDSAAVYLRKV